MKFPTIQDLIRAGCSPNHARRVRRSGGGRRADGGAVLGLAPLRRLSPVTR